MGTCSKNRSRAIQEARNPFPITKSQTMEHRLAALERVNPSASVRSRVRQSGSIIIKPKVPVKQDVFKQVLYSTLPPEGIDYTKSPYHYNPLSPAFSGLEPYRPVDFPKTYHIKAVRENYPDIGYNYHQYITHILDNLKTDDFSVNFNKFFNFKTGGPWDLKKKAGLPPPGTWALYRGELVSDAYLANNAFGQAMAKSGVSLKGACGFGQLFSWKSRFNWDQAEDQEAIKSGWYDYMTGNPWAEDIKKPIHYENRK